jgi:biotin carboxyl carrier protein
MKKYEITLNGHTFHIRLLSDPLQDQVEVEVDGQTFTVAVEVTAQDEEPPCVTVAPLSERAQPTAPIRQPVETATSPGNAVIAPLPGVIKSIAVRPGQQVSPGDTLLVIEAMKMNNILRASQEGIVETIHTAEGHQVAHGELLLEYRM